MVYIRMSLVVFALDAYVLTALFHLYYLLYSCVQEAYYQRSFYLYYLLYAQQK